MINPNESSQLQMHNFLADENQINYTTDSSTGAASLIDADLSSIMNRLVFKDEITDSPSRNQLLILDKGSLECYV